MNSSQVRKASFKGMLTGSVADYAKAGQNKISAIITDMRKKGLSPIYINETKQKAYDALKADILNMSKLEKDKTMLKISRLKEVYLLDYERNEKRNEKNVIDYERRLAGLTAKELEKEIERYNESGEGWDYRLVDALSAEVKYNLPESLDDLRESAERKNYTQPFLASDEGKKLSNELEALESCVNHPGNFPAVIIDETTGKETFMVASIDDLLIEDENNEVEVDDAVSIQ